MKHLTPSKEHYIKAIHTLSSNGEGARISDIAESLSVSKASVCVAMDALQERKLIERDAEHRVLLTPEGRQNAVLLEDRYALISRFLETGLQVSPETAQTDACALEHVISDETILCMNKFMETHPVQKENYK